MGEKPVIVVQQKTTSSCMVALWMLILLGAMALGGCFLVGKCAQLVTEEDKRDPAIDLEAVDQELESRGQAE